MTAILAAGLTDRVTSQRTTAALLIPSRSTLKRRQMHRTRKCEAADINLRLLQDRYQLFRWNNYWLTTWTHCLQSSTWKKTFKHYLLTLHQTSLQQFQKTAVVESGVPNPPSLNTHHSENANDALPKNSLRTKTFANARHDPTGQLYDEAERCCWRDDPSNMAWVWFNSPIRTSWSSSRLHSASKRSKEKPSVKSLVTTISHQPNSGASGEYARV